MLFMPYNENGVYVDMDGTTAGPGSSRQPLRDSESKGIVTAMVPTIREYRGRRVAEIVIRAYPTEALLVWVLAPALARELELHEPLYNREGRINGAIINTIANPLFHTTYARSEYRGADTSAEVTARERVRSVFDKYWSMVNVADLQVPIARKSIGDTFAPTGPAVRPTIYLHERDLFNSTIHLVDRDGNTAICSFKELVREGDERAGNELRRFGDIVIRLAVTERRLP